jgi:glutamate carboxypeptidase
VSAPTTARAGELLDWMRGRTDDMCATAEKLVAAESPTGDAAGIDRATGYLGARLEALGFRLRTVAGVAGNHLLAVPRSRDRAAPVQLMIGHIDTVWPRGTIDSMPCRRDHDRLLGPGVLDMKGGLVQMLYALEALGEAGVALPATPLVFVNCDEETGSRDSTRHVRRLARASARAFVLEPADGPRGALKTTRKGVGRFTVRIEGHAAHAGLSPGEGASAILEMSHLVQELFQLNDPERGVTVNVGTVDGGLGANVIAPTVVAEVDVRAWTQADADRVEERIRDLAPTNPRCAIRVDGGFGRPPMEQTDRNEALWRRAVSAARALDLDIARAGVGGASDANTTTRYTATLDGLGAVGQGAHAVDEQLVITRMPERAALLAVLLASGLEGP